jgi:hypothetical protein
MFVVLQEGSTAAHIAMSCGSRQQHIVPGLGAEVTAAFVFTPTWWVPQVLNGPSLLVKLKILLAQTLPEGGCPLAKIPPTVCALDLLK